MADKSIQLFYCDMFQVAENLPQDVEVPALCDELLSHAYAILGIIDGGIPDNATLSNVARFLIDAAQAGYRAAGAKA